MYVIFPKTFLSDNYIEDSNEYGSLDVGKNRLHT